MKNRMFGKVSENLDLRASGISRSSGDPRLRLRSIGELLELAKDRDGVYGAENKPVSGDMTVLELLDWHADFKWSIANSETEIYRPMRQTVHFRYEACCMVCGSLGYFQKKNDAINCAERHSCRTTSVADRMAHRGNAPIVWKRN